MMDLLGKELEAEREIDLTKPETDYGAYSFGPEDLCLIGVPSFGGRMPGTALERLKKMQGNSAKAVMVVTYGNRAYDDTLLELKEELCASGFRAIGALAAVTEHSIMHQFGAGRPDQEDQKELKAFAAQIKEKLKHQDGGTKLEVPGNQPYREYHGVPFKPKAGKKCRKCGICAKQCPVLAIPKDHPESVDADRCISCMRCVSVCPEQARDLSRAVLLVASGKMKKACSGRKPNELFL